MGEANVDVSPATPPKWISTNFVTVQNVWTLAALIYPDGPTVAEIDWTDGLVLARSSGPDIDRGLLL